MRTAQQAFDDLTRRGRTLEQIRCIATARGDAELKRLAIEAIREGAA